MSTLLSPHELRDRLVKLYTRSFERAYGRAEHAEIERKVIADMQLVDAARARGTLRTPALDMRRADIKPDVKYQRRPDKAASPSTRYLAPALHANPLEISEQYACAAARLQRICEGAGGSSDLITATGNAAIPKLAKRALDTFSFYMFRNRPAPTRGVDHNPFRGLSDEDANRAFVRALFDICDASTGLLGHWYVK